MQALLDLMPNAVAVLAPVWRRHRIEDWIIRAASPTAVDVRRRRGRGLVGLRVLSCYPGIAGTELWRAYLDVFDGAGPRTVGPFVYRDDAAGVPADAEYSVHVRGYGPGLLVAWERHDEHRRQNERFDLVQRLGNLGWTEWDLTTGTLEWSRQMYEIFDRDPADGPVSVDDLPTFVLEEDLPALRDASTRQLRGDTRVELDYRIRTPRGRVKHLRAVRDLGYDASGRLVIMRSVVQDITAGERLRDRLAETSRRLAERERHLREEHNLTVRLQEIIAPAADEPIDLPGLRAAVRYLPAEQASRVGGDWYHATAMRDGRVLLALGDVAGHGLAAAAQMARLQHALAALAVTTRDPGSLLRYLNEVMYDSGHTTATAVVGCFDPGTGVLSWAQAGHLPPLLARGGVTGPLPRPAGMLLGGRPDSRYETAALGLDAGDVLVFYTDGLIERPGEQVDLDGSIAGLAAATQRAIDDAPTRPLHSILSRLNPANPADDSCILAVRRLAPATPPGPVAAR